MSFLEFGELSNCLHQKIEIIQYGGCELLGSPVGTNIPVTTLAHNAYVFMHDNRDDLKLILVPEQSAENMSIAAHYTNKSLFFRFANHEWRGRFSITTTKDGKTALDFRVESDINPTIT